MTTKLRRLGTLFLVLTMICSTLTINVFSLEGKDMITYTVDYNETKESALIKFDVANVDIEKYEIQEMMIENKILDLSLPQYQVKENKEYNFIVKYIDKEESNIKEVEETIKETNEDLKEDNTLDKKEEVQTEVNEEIKDSNKKIEKEQTITVKVDGILSVEDTTPIAPNTSYTSPAYASNTARSTNSGEGNIDMQGMFDVVGQTWKGAGTGGAMIPTGNQGVAQMITVNSKNIHIGNGAYAKANGYTNLTTKVLSKFEIDMDRSFILNGKVETKGYNPDGFVIGLINNSSKNAFLMNQPTGGNLGVYNIPEINGAIFYEIDLYGTDSMSSLLDHLIPNSKKTTPHTMMAYIKNGVPKNITMPEYITIDTVADKREFSIQYNKSTDVLEINYGDKRSQYVGASTILDENSVRFFVNGAVDSWKMPGTPYNGNIELDLQVNFFNYTDVEPTSSVGYYTKRNDSMITYDSSNYTTYPRAGETVLVRYEMNNEIDTDLDLTTTANIATATIDGSASTPKNIKMYTGSPDNPMIEAMDEKDIFNGSVNDTGLKKQVTVPIMANQGKTYLEYEYTVPSDVVSYQIEDTITFGQQGMTQYSFNGETKIASAPIVSGVDQTIVSPMGTGSMSANQIRQGMEGKAFDETNLSNLESDTSKLQGTYTVDGSTSKQIDLTKEERYFVEYTIEDIRTGLKKNVSRYIWVTDKQTVVNGDEIMAAKDFYLLSSEVDSSLSSLIKERSGIEVYRTDGTVIPFEQLTVTQDIKGTFGTYPVTFTTVAGTTITIQCRVFDNGNIDETNKEGIYANDFSLSEAEATVIEEVDLIKMANVMAFDMVTMDPVAVHIENNTIQGKSQGVYPLTFVTVKGSKITVQVRVTKHGSNANGQRVTANDFYIDAMQAKRKDPKVLLELAKASAVTIANGQKVELQVDASQLLSVKGSYPVTFKTDLGTSLTVQATVLEKGTVDKTTGESIYGNNFSMTSKEVVEILTKSDRDIVTALIQKAGAKAIDMDTGVNLSIVAVDQRLRTKEITDGDGNRYTVAIEGLYDITFKTAKGTSVTVKASVPSSIENDTLLLYGNGFTISKDQVASLVEADYLRLGKAQAIVKLDSTPVTVKVDSSAMEAKVGEYTIKYQTDYTIDPTKNLTLPVKVTVVEKGVVDPSTQESISANNIYLKVSEISSLTSQKLVDKASASAMKTNTGEYVEVEAIYDIKEKAGTYTVTFETALGTSLSVQAYVYDEGNVNETDQEAIYGNHFTLSIEEVGSINETLLKNRAQVKAIDTVTKEDVAITSATHGITNKVGMYTATFATTKGTTITVKVQVVGHGVSENGVTIVANDIQLSIDEVKGLTSTQVVALSKAKGYQTIDGTPVELESDFTNVEEKKGVYDVIVRSIDGKASLTIQAYVYDYGVIQGNIAMYGNDIEISKEEARGINDHTIRQLANVKAYRVDSGIEINSSDITVFHTIEQKVGKYSVIFTTNLVGLEVHAYVRDYKEQENQERITGNDFSISLGEVAGLTEEKVLQLSHGKAYSTVDGKAIEVGAKYSALQERPGTYTISLETKTVHKTKIAVEVTVLDNGLTEGTIKEGIYADNFSLSVSEARDVSEETLKRLSNVRAVDLDTGAKVEVTGVEHAISNVKGEYEATFKTTKNTSVTVQVTVVENEVVNPDKNEKIIANDFVVTKQEVEQGVSDAKILQLSKAKAYNTLTNTEIAIPTIEHSMEVQVGSYEVSLSTVEGTTIIVKATVVDHGIVDETTREAMYGNNFTISLEQVEQMDNALLKELSNIQAMNMDTGASVAIQRVRHTVVAKKGVYEVTFFTAKGTNLTVKATVVDHGIVDKTTREAMYGNNFMISLEQVEQINDGLLKDLSNVQAMNIDTGASVEVTKVEHNMVSTKGVYEVTFSTTKGTKLTVKATVVDHGIIDETTREAMYGNDFMISLEQVEQINDALLKDLSNVQAINMDTGASVEVTKVEHNMVSTKGVYEVTFSTTKGTRLTVKATVVDHGIIDETTREAMYGNDFMISLEQVEQINDALLKELSNVQAINIDTGASVEVTKVEHNMVSTKGVYEVTFSTTKGTKLTVKATVVDTTVPEVPEVPTQPNLPNDPNNTNASKNNQNSIKGIIDQILHVDIRDATDTTVSSTDDVTKKGATSNMKNNQGSNLNGREENADSCYSHWGMLAVTGVYIMIMVAYKRKGNENE